MVASRTHGNPSLAFLSPRKLTGLVVELVAISKEHWHKSFTFSDSAVTGVGLHDTYFLRSSRSLFMTGGNSFINLSKRYIFGFSHLRRYFYLVHFHTLSLVPVSSGL